MRQYFGTDGVRGVVGEDLTADLVERLGRAATVWSGRGRIFIGRDTRASGLELEQALARGISSAGGNAVIAGVLPTPAVALLTLDLGCVITASHNPPEYNGVKFFDGDGMKLSDATEEELESLLTADAAGHGGGPYWRGFCEDVWGNRMNHGPRRLCRHAHALLERRLGAFIRKGGA